MNHSNFKYLLLSFILSSALLICNKGFAQEQILTISGASFKPFRYLRLASVSEMDGCFSDVNFSILDLATGSFIKSLDVYIFNDSAMDEVNVSLFRQDFFQQSDSILNLPISIQPGYNIKSIAVNGGYLIQEKGSFTLSFSYDDTSDLRVCGVKVHYLVAGEVIFNSGFD